MIYYFRRGVWKRLRFPQRRERIVALSVTHPPLRAVGPHRVRRVVE